MVKDYQLVLKEALEKAINHIKAEDTTSDLINTYPSLSTTTYREIDQKIIALGNIGTAIDTIISNLNRNKYLFSIAITALVTKIVSPEVDIRNHQSDMENGYSNRSIDQTYVTPFLKKSGLTHCATSGMESGRNFERPLPLKLNFPAKPRGSGNREAILSILHAVQVDEVDPSSLLIYFFYKDLLDKKLVNYEYPTPKGLTIQEIIDAIVNHFNQSQGQGKSRLPVLAIQAIYECITPELKRYQNKTLVNVARQTANDKKGSIGDIQVNHNNGKPFEGIEVKSGKQITVDMIRSIPIKLQGNPVERYYILSTEENYIKPTETIEIMQAVDEIREKTGCEIIPNGLIRSLWYYLRLISDKDFFINCYTRLLKEDKDVREPQR